MSNESTFNKLPPIAKIAIVIGGTLVTLSVLGFGGYAVYKAIKKKSDSKDSKAETDDIKKDLNVLLVSGKKPTMTPSQIMAVANALFTAMDGYGTDSDTIIHEFAKIMNDADMLSVSKAYGVRTLSSGAFNPEPNVPQSLNQALKNELAKDVIMAINGQLARKGIKNRL